MIPSSMTAIEVQREYYLMAEQAYRNRDTTTNQILDMWKFTLDTLKLIR